MNMKNRITKRLITANGTKFIAFVSLVNNAHDMFKDDVEEINQMLDSLKEQLKDESSTKEQIIKKMNKIITNIDSLSVNLLAVKNKINQV